MRRAGRLAAETLDLITPHVKPGARTGELDDICRQFIESRGAVPAPLGYRGFPRSICTSVNHVVCHGIPGAPIPRADPEAMKRAAKTLSPRKRAEGEHAVYHLTRADDRLVEGDVVNIDVTVILDGWHGDTSRMYAVGHISRRAERLIEVTYEALMRGVAAVKPGNTTGHIGAAIQNFAERERCSVVRDFCGHGLGRVFHDRPNILHYGEPGDGVALEPGMLFTIEPMINLGKPHVKILTDGWTAVTRDRELSAQFEHTVGVTETGCEVFTISPAGLHKPPYRLSS
jgi:methionyl aminopeptidase